MASTYLLSGHNLYPLRDTIQDGFSGRLYSSYQSRLAKLSDYRKNWEMV